MGREQAACSASSAEMTHPDHGRLLEQEILCSFLTDHHCRAACSVCTGCAMQVCCPGKAPAKCKLSQVNSSSKLLQGELCAKIKKKKIQQDRQTLLKLYFSSFKAVSSFQLFPHTHSFSRTEYNRPDEMSKSNPCIRQGQQ